MQSVVRKRTGETWGSAVTLVWTVLVVSADLKVGISPYIHWAVSVIAAVLLFPYFLRFLVVPYICHTERFPRVPAMLPAALFVFSVLLPVFYGAELGHSAEQAAKLIVILLGSLALFAARPHLLSGAFSGLIVAVWVNVILVVLNLFVGAGTAGLMTGDGRWGTLLNYPGSLWRMAISVWMFAAYRVAKEKSIPSFALLVGSTVLILMDGARTGIILVSLGVLFLMFVLSSETKHSRLVLCISFAAVIGVSGFMARSRLLSGSANNAVGGATRVGNVEDITRLTMLQDAIYAVQSHPVFGTGIETTKSETIIGPMVVHMTYLQVWADLGLFGLAAYVCLVWGWLPWLPRMLRGLRNVSDCRSRAICYNAIFLLMVFGLAGIFHPLSTEWSEWILFIIPYAIVRKFALFEPRIVEAHV